MQYSYNAHTIVKTFILLLTVGMLFFGAAAHAQETGEILQDKVEILKVKVQSIDKTTTEQLGWKEDVKTQVQDITALILNGDAAGTSIHFKNDFKEVTKGDTVYINHRTDLNGNEYYSVYELDRTTPILLLVGLFIILLLLFGGMQGLRALIALAGSLCAIIFVLIPLVLAGYNPLLVSVSIAAAILFMAVFFTHGFNRGSAVAFAGTILAVGITGLLAYVAIHITSLTGMASDESTYLRFNFSGDFDFIGLLLGAIIIGALGALDDIAVTQVAVVRELFATDKTQHFMEVYTKAMRVGKEHVGALVNTLVLAYTGMALPLMLLYAQSAVAGVPFISIEIFATEIVRTIVGSIGLILAVPITTILAVYFMKDAKALPESFGHSHGH